MKKMISKLPDAIIVTNQMPEPNSNIVIYEGEFVIKNTTDELKLNGRIVYEWFANTGVYFYGNSTYLVKFSELPNLSNIYSIFVNGLQFGEGFITSSQFKDFSEIKIKGVISKQAILGDSTIPVEKIQFSIPNFRDFHGLPVKRISEGNDYVSLDRIILEDETYKIIFDKCSDFKKRKQDLEEKGGYHILYNGELYIKRGHLTHAETRDIFYCLANFLTFLNGRRTSCLFIKGLFEEKTIWTDYTDYPVDSFKFVQTWPQRHSNENLTELWKRFRALWLKSTDDKNFLTSLIHWYVEGNGNTGLLEGSIILAQTALELVYNWWIVENKKMILGKDSENISASNKIRLLISQLNLTSDIPIVFNELQTFKDATANVTDAPDTIVYIRNAIVHSQEEKRNKLSTIHSKVIYEALQVYIWYIELTLLRILEYKDGYFNRCSKEMNVSNAEDQVPW